MVAASVLYALSFLGPESDSGSSADLIVVDRDTILRFMQFRSRAFNTKSFEARLDEMGDSELERLIDDFVQEEVLFREAKALELDKNDYLARRRLVSQMEFLVRGLEEVQLNFSEAELRDYYSSHLDDYSVRGDITFTHVYFDTNNADALSEAERYREKLNAEVFSAASARATGDRFLFHLHYPRKTEEEVSSHFGRAFAQIVFSMSPNVEQWQGPVRSEHGWHLILLSQRRLGRQLSFEESRDQVEEDVKFEVSRQRQESAIENLVADYRVQRSTPIRSANRP